MPRPEAVIFDIGNVLIEWQPERYYDTFLTKAERRRMFKTVDLHGMNDSIDRGGDFLATVSETARQNPEFGDAIMHWHSNWLNLAAPAIVASVETARALRQRGVRTFILSNIGTETYALAAERYPFLTAFDRHYISAELGVIKPEAPIYAHVEQDCGIAPENLLFTDDRPDNIAAASNRGWQTHLFDGPDGWVNRLKAQSLIEQDFQFRVPA